MLDSDISLLTEEIAGVLQTLSPKQEQTHADKGLKIKGLFQEISDLGNKIDNELDALVMAYKGSPEKIENLDDQTAQAIKNLDSPDRMTNRTGRVHPSKWSIPANGGRVAYRTQIYRAFSKTIMDQYVDDRLIIINSLEALSANIRSMDSPKKWGQLTDQHYEGFRKHIKNELNNWNRLQTVEELSRLFESAPNLMELIEMQVAKVLKSR